MINGFAVVIWTYFIGWMFLGGLLSKFLPPIVAKIIGAIIGLFTGAMVSLVVFHS